MRTISDAGPLIRFGRINQLGVLRHLFGKIEIVPEVEVEIMRGLSYTPPKPDALAIQAELQTDWLCVTGPVAENAASQLARGGHLGHDGESKSVDLLHEIQDAGEDALFLTDDRQAFEDAWRYAVNVLSTIHVVEKAIGQQLVAEQRAHVYSGMGVVRPRYVGNILDDFIRRYGEDPFA